MPFDSIIPQFGTAKLRLHLHPAATRRAWVPLLLLVAWQASASAGWIDARMVPPPATIATTAFDMVRDGSLPGNLLISLARVAAGLAIAVVLGVCAGVVAGLSRRGEDALDATLQMGRTLPHLALIPLLILWFGIGETPKVALVAFGAFFPIYLNLFAGIRSVDPRLVEAAGTLGLSRATMVGRVILPGALPQALVGLRYGVGVAWLSLVVGEQINAESGIGHLMMDARDFNLTNIIMVGLLVYALLGLGSDALVRWLEQALLAWRPPARVGR